MRISFIRSASNNLFLIKSDLISISKLEIRQIVYSVASVRYIAQNLLNYSFSIKRPYKFDQKRFWCALSPKVLFEFYLLRYLPSCAISPRMTDNVARLVSRPFSSAKACSILSSLPRCSSIQLCALLPCFTKGCTMLRRVA